MLHLNVAALQHSDNILYCILPLPTLHCCNPREAPEHFRKLCGGWAPRECCRRRQVASDWGREQGLGSNADRESTQLRVDLEVERRVNAHLQSMLALSGSQAGGPNPALQGSQVRTVSREGSPSGTLSG